MIKVISLMDKINYLIPYLANDGCELVVLFKTNKN